MFKRITTTRKFYRLYLWALEQYMRDPSTVNGKRVMFYARSYNKYRYWWNREIMPSFDI